MAGGPLHSHQSWHLQSLSSHASEPRGLLDCRHLVYSYDQHENFIGATRLKVIMDDKPGCHVLASIRLAEVIGEALGLTGPSVRQIQEGAHGCARPDLCGHHITTHCGPGPLSDGMAGMEITGDTWISLH